MTARIGPSGGRLTSAGGDLELVVPPGALAAETELSMTPITTEAPLAAAPAVRLGPSGTSFIAPASLVLHVPRGVDGSSPDLLLLVRQDAQGIWQPVGSVTVDPSARTVSAPVAHFSDWSFVACAKLEVDQYVLGPGITAHLNLVQMCATPSQQVAGLAVPAPVSGTVDWSKTDVSGGPGPGTLTPSGPSATLDGVGEAPADPRVVITARWNGRSYVDTIALASMMSYTLDGKDVIIGPTKFAVPLAFTSTSEGNTLLGGANDQNSLNVGFAGVGAGEFTSVTGGVSSRDYSGTPELYYDNHYIVPCTTNIKDLPAKVNVSHANADRGFLTGWFEGTVATHRGQIHCSGIDEADYVELPLVGAFFLRWQRL